MKAKVPIIPMEDFMRNPEKSSFQISPNGNYVAFMKPWKNRMNVFVKDMKTNKEERLTASEKRGIYGFTWLTNNRIGYVKDDGGNDILVVDTSTGAITTTFSGNIVVPTLKISDLTDNRVLIAGTSGEVEDDVNLTFDGSIFKVGTTDAIVIPSGTTAQRPTAQTGMLRFNSCLLYTSDAADE